jgi:hypothetical protein
MSTCSRRTESTTLDGVDHPFRLASGVPSILSDIPMPRLRTTTSARARSAAAPL